MGLEGCEAQLYDSCTDFLQACLDVGKNETYSNLFKLYNYRFDFQNVKKQLDTAKQLHDHRLDKIGEKSHLHRCHKIPFDEKLKKKKKFKRPKELPLILGREKNMEIQEKAKNDNKVALFIKNVSEKQKDDLCRGKEIRLLDEVAKLKCFYGHNSSPWLKLGPFKVEENSQDPYHVTIHELLYDHECDNITQFLGPMLDFPPGM